MGNHCGGHERRSAARPDVSLRQRLHCQPFRTPVLCSQRLHCQPFRTPVLCDQYNGVDQSVFC